MPLRGPVAQDVTEAVNSYPVKDKGVRLFGSAYLTSSGSEAS